MSPCILPSSLECHAMFLNFKVRMMMIIIIIIIIIIIKRVNIIRINIILI